LIRDIDYRLIIDYTIAAAYPRWSDGHLSE
jgi:hypothetical protein